MAIEAQARGVAGGATAKLAEFATQTRLADVPTAVLTQAKRNLLDTLAVTIGGCVEPSAKIAADLVRDLGCRPAATAIGHNLRTSAEAAAFLNGVAGHALEYDDTWVSSTRKVANHISVCVLPAALAVAESSGATGAEMLAAYLIGYEVAARIGLGLIESKLARLGGWHPVSVIGPLGAAVSAGRVLGLTRLQMRWAMGIAASQAGGLRKNVATMTKPFHAGHAARAGVVAAQLASRGFEANPDILEEGPPGMNHDHFGYCEAFAGADNFNVNRMTDSLGDVWELPFTVIKHHPGTIRAVPVDLTVALVKENGIEADAIERIDVGVTHMFNIGPTTRIPLGSQHSRFSLWYNIAVAAIDRQAGLAEFTAERVARPDILPFIERVNVYVDDELDGQYRAGLEPFGGSARVTIRLKDGQSYTRESSTTRGYLDAPSSWADVLEKLRECVVHNGGLAPNVADHIADLTSRVEVLPQASELIEAVP